MSTRYAIPRDTHTFALMSGIGDFIRERRRGSQRDLAELSGIDRSYLAQIEGGRVKLPNADMRRRLAKALGVSHLDLLIAAGELLPEEVAEAGKEGVIEANPVIESMIQALRSLPWDKQDVELAHAVLTRRMPDVVNEEAVNKGNQP